jgi:hypothetical protein
VEANDLVELARNAERRLVRLTTAPSNVSAG